MNLGMILLEKEQPWVEVQPCAPLLSGPTSMNGVWTD